MLSRRVVTLGRSAARALSLSPAVHQSDASSAKSESIGYNFELTNEQKEFLSTVRKFVRDEIIPVAPELDRTSEFPWSVLKKAHATGLLDAEISADVGGIEIDPISNALLMESIGYGCTGIGTIVMTNALAETPLNIAGSMELKKKYLGRMIEQPLVASYAVTEPGAGSDVGGIRTRSEKKGDEYIINGAKMWITNAGHANWFFVLTRSDPNPKAPASKAFTAFIVDGDAPGVIRGKKETNMGQHTSDTRGVTFEDVRVPASNVVGKPGEGFIVAMRTFDRTRPFIAAMATGLQARCLDEASKYALERKAFGKPISEFQGVAFMLADMAMNLELSRLMTYRSAAEILTARYGSYFSSIAKCFAADAANAAASNAVQVFGGNGYSSEYPVEKLMRDAKVFQIYEGTSQVQRVVISRHLLRRVKETGTAALV